MDSRLGSRLVFRAVGHCFNVQFICRLNEDQSMIADWLRIAAKKVSVNVERAGHPRRNRHIKIRLTAFQVHITRKNGLAIFHDVKIRSAAFARGENLEMHHIARAIKRVFGSQQDLVCAVAVIKGNLC